MYNGEKNKCRYSLIVITFFFRHMRGRGGPMRGGMMRPMGPRPP